MVIFELSLNAVLVNPVISKFYLLKYFFSSITAIIETLVLVTCPLGNK